MGACAAANRSGHRPSRRLPADPSRRPCQPTGRPCLVEKRHEDRVECLWDHCSAAARRPRLVPFRGHARRARRVTLSLDRLLAATRSRRNRRCATRRNAACARLRRNADRDARRLRSAALVRDQRRLGPVAHREGWGLALHARTPRCRWDEHEGAVARGGRRACRRRLTRAHRHAPRCERLVPGRSLSMPRASTRRSSTCRRPGAGSCGSEPVASPERSSSARSTGRIAAP